MKKPKKIDVVFYRELPEKSILAIFPKLPFNGVNGNVQAYSEIDGHTCTTFEYAKDRALCEQCEEAKDFAHVQAYLENLGNVLNIKNCLKS